MSVAGDNCAIKFMEAVFKKFAPVSPGGKKEERKWLVSNVPTVFILPLHLNPKK